MVPGLPVHRSAWAALDSVTAYRLLALRAAAFVVEQACVYLDPDGRDLEPNAEQWWIADGERVVACLRVLEEGSGVRRIGRVATDPAWRGRGLARELVVGVLGAYPREEFVLAAQAQLTEWYARLGFVVEGEPFDEDDILHVAMRRRARPGVVSAG